MFIPGLKLDYSRDSLNINGEEIEHDYYYPSINTSDFDSVHIELDRKLPKKIIENHKSNRMLGLQITWNYNREFKNWAKYSNEDTSKEFVR